MNSELYNIPVKTIDNQETKLDDKYQGKVLMIVNVASQCGLTPQYEQLEKIYEKYKDQGFFVLGFPANEFGAQEPGSNEEIKDFCQTNFNIKFPMFSKMVVKGEGQHPLYKYLTSTKPDAKGKEGSQLLEILKKEGLLTGESHDIAWNFEKFLINRQGEVVERFNPDMTPDNPLITQAIEEELKK